MAGGLGQLGQKYKLHLTFWVRCPAFNVFYGIETLQVFFSEIMKYNHDSQDLASIRSIIVHKMYNTP